MQVRILLCSVVSGALPCVFKVAERCRKTAGDVSDQEASNKLPRIVLCWGAAQDLRFSGLRPRLVGWIEALAFAQTGAWLPSLAQSRDQGRCSLTKRMIRCPVHGRWPLSESCVHMFICCLDIWIVCWIIRPIIVRRVHDESPSSPSRDQTQMSASI